MLRRLRLTRISLLTIYAAIGALGLGIIAIAIAVTQGSATAGHVALGLVLGGTVIILAGLGVAAMSVAKSGEALDFAVARTTNLPERQPGRSARAYGLGVDRVFGARLTESASRSRSGSPNIVGCLRA